MHTAINQERAKNGLSSLKNNSDLAAVAREHSENLAKASDKFNKIGRTCNFPMIHHEGLDFGLYHYNRLNNRGIYYYGSTAENIALMPSAQFLINFTFNDPLQSEMNDCSDWELERNNALKSTLEDADDADKINIINTEIEKRIAKYNAGHDLKIKDITWKSDEEIVANTVQGWMNSPGHRKNILYAAYDEAGIGIAFTDGYIIATQIFIKRAACGYKDGPCCERTGYYPYCYVPYSCSVNICQ